MLRHWLAVLGVLTAIAAGAMAQQEACNTKLSCSDCYKTDGCVFCGAKQLNTTLNRCVSQQNIPEVWESQCPPDHRYMAVSNVTITDSSETAGRKIRLSPSKMALEIGQGQSHNVTISVEVFDNPALELYIIMDLSRSMWDDKETLYAIMQELIAELQKLVLDPPKIGFGAFVDKPVLPYISLVAGGYTDSLSCTVDDVICDAPWGFRHYKTLTEDVEEVKKAIKNAPVAVNKDPAEGGFDGVMQAIVCKEVMGWTDGTEKMLVYLSDASPHLAGDGRLAGIMVPNDMACHMMEEPGKNYTHVYSHSSSMDYPSIGQITQKAEEYGISVIFLSNKEHVPLYSRISHIIKDSSYAAITKNSSNIVDLITNEYEKIQQKLSIKASKSDGMSLRYFSKCKGDILYETTTCSNLEKKNTVEFIIEVTMENCDEFQEGHNIKIWSFGDEKNPLELTINPLCKCSCEDPTHPDFENTSPDCSYEGDMMCGVCSCHEGYGGKTCDCSDKTDVDAGSLGCRPGNSTVECYDRGICECNECQCEEGYTGRYCECDNLNCERGLGGKLCSGNGDCECGLCTCYNGWTGESCSCSAETDNCINPASAETCSMNGRCECNRCICNNTEYSYTGLWCETCKDCPKRCKELGPCVLCYHAAQGDDTPCEDQCSQFQLQFTFLEHMDEPSEGDVLCSVYDSEDCRVSFLYGPGDDGKLHLQVLEKKECPIPVPILALVLGIIGAIVVLGLIALLVWKCYANYQDRLEYQKFLMEQANAKWSEDTNPMYKPATTTTQNPLFGMQE